MYRRGGPVRLVFFRFSTPMREASNVPMSWSLLTAGVDGRGQPAHSGVVNGLAAGLELVNVGSRARGFVPQETVCVSHC